ncbi:uncharacterized protein LOC131874056 [Cryptomeria japonica]|uniref:uncharacterized protein LOC131874056 n=1 Tax=Cryptomeria japonica TaxID=3369 RepID=UPI0027DA4AF8|nr:uncharacterized protein LOC131874056 [Cryptomeria japonica]
MPVNGRGWVQSSSSSGFEETWKQPSEGWWKINLDGASKGNPRPSGVRFIVRDWKGDVVALDAQKLNPGTNNIVEASVALIAIRFCRKIGVIKLHLEGDSLIIIQTIMKGTIKAWHLQNSILSIVEELNNFEDFRVSHIRRTGNVEADILSKWALTFNEIGELRFEDLRHINIEF